MQLSTASSHTMLLVLILSYNMCASAKGGGVPTGRVIQAAKLKPANILFTLFSANPPNLIPTKFSGYTIVTVNRQCLTYVLALFPGLPRLQFLIACSMRKRREKT